MNRSEEQDLIFGKNAVLAFLEADESQAAQASRRKSAVNKIFIAVGQQFDRRVDRIKALARQLEIPVVSCEKRRLDQMVPQDQRHQGIVAQISVTDFQDLDEFLEGVDNQRKAAEQKGDNAGNYLDGFVVAVLDGIEDPHNLGAIIRVAECSGVKAVLLPARRSAGLTGIVAKTSAGAIATLPVVRIQNITKALNKLKEFGFWVAGLDADAPQTYSDADLNRPLAIVVGSEGKGIGRLVGENCDMLLKIPMLGKTESLNASVAAGIVFYEVLRQVNLAKKQKAKQK